MNGPSKYIDIMQVNSHHPRHDVTKQDGRNTYDDTGDRLAEENADAHGQAVKGLIIISLFSKSQHQDTVDAHL